MISYPKIYQMGHAALAELLLDEVVVEEKVDGSQLRFGVCNGQAWLSSRGKDQTDNTDKMFGTAKRVVQELAPSLVEGWIYCGEYLQTPKHNTLAYDRVPLQHIMLFDVMIGVEMYLNRAEKEAEAERLALECVPLYFQGMLKDVAAIPRWLERKSVLGGKANIEGVVIKNYARFGKDKKILLGKFVSDDFKEAHKTEWKKTTGPSDADILQVLGTNYCTTARWRKAAQRLRDAGQLAGEPKDIAALVRSVQEDVLKECEDEIKEVLFQWAWRSIERAVVRGIPVWYKNELLKQQIMNEDSNVSNIQEKETA